MNCADATVFLMTVQAWGFTELTVCDYLDDLGLTQSSVILFVTSGPKIFIVI